MVLFKEIRTILNFTFRGEDRLAPSINKSYCLFSINFSNIKNVILIDNRVKSYTSFYNNCNSYTLPIVYDYSSDKNNETASSPSAVANTADYKKVFIIIIINLG